MGPNIPLHSAIEVFGSFAAINAAIIMLFLRHGQLSAAQSLWVICGLIAMGILDIFHGAVPPGKTFVWFHSTANFFGGLLFALAWLDLTSQRVTSLGAHKTAAMAAIIVTVATLLFGFYSVIFPDTLPPMIVQGKFTTVASLLNFSAGIFFLLAAPVFLIGFSSRKNRDDLLFFVVTILFGLAELLFHYSKLWDTTWWIWHFMRLIALTAVMTYVFIIFRRFNNTVITEAVDEIVTSTNDITAIVDQHEHTAQQQVSAVNETATTIEELAASARQSSKQAGANAGLAKEAGHAAAQGTNAIRQAVVGMTNLKEKMTAMAEHVLHLGQQTDQIGGIATILKDLSGEINMLALNAAVEAARAGEQGKGFAVVASEVRKLAVESRKSAEQASAIVAETQKITDASIKMTEEGASSVAEVAKLASEADELFAQLANMTMRVNENAQQVVLNTKQQATAFAQVAEAVSSIASGAKTTASGISYTKTGVQKLNKAAERLKAIQ